MELDLLDVVGSATKVATISRTIWNSCTKSERRTFTSHLLDSGKMAVHLTAREGPHLQQQRLIVNCAIPNKHENQQKQNGLPHFHRSSGRLVAAPVININIIDKLILVEEEEPCPPTGFIKLYLMDSPLPPLPHVAFNYGCGRRGASLIFGRLIFCYITRNVN